MNIAVIKTGGKQYIVSPGQKIKIEKIDSQEGDQVDLGDVLLYSDDKKTIIGQPLVIGAKVSAKIIKQDKAKKVIVYKYKAKKRYQVKRGHRQPFTFVEVQKISAK